MANLARRHLLGSVLLAGGLLGARHGSAATLTPVSFASVNALSDAGVFLADDLGFFAAQGIALQAQVITSAPALITAVATGQVDVAGAAFTPGMFAAVQRGIELRVVGDKQSIRPGFSNTRLVVRKASYKGDRDAAIAGLRGGNFGVTSRGSTAFYLGAKTLAKHGVPLSAVNVIEMEYANILVGLDKGALDGGMLLDPYLTKAIAGGVAAEVSDCADVAPGGNPTITALVYSETFARQRDLAQRWMLAYVRGVRAYNDAFLKEIDRPRVVEILARHTGMAAAIVQNSFPVGLDPDQAINLAAIDDFQDFFVSLNLMKQRTDPSRFVDTSFATAAVAQLGRYASVKG
jgi:NitT/TauT family transport system substrate-binding protein